MLKKIKEIAGQLVFDHKWHCSMCGRDYHGKRCHKMRIWIRMGDRAKGKIRYEAHEIRLCVTDETVAGCYEMGLGQLFRAMKRGA